MLKIPVVSKFSRGYQLFFTNNNNFEKGSFIPTPFLHGNNLIYSANNYLSFIKEIPKQKNLEKSKLTRFLVYNQ